MKALYLLRLALQNLYRGGQRSLIALLSITFGIMALVSLTTIAESIDSAVRLSPIEAIGGDMSLVRKAEAAVDTEHTAQLDAFQQSGKLSRYTLIALNDDALVMHIPKSGAVHFAGAGMGVEPEKYPLAGRLAIGKPAGTGLPDLLRRAGEVVITRDLAAEYDLQVGDVVILSDLRTGARVEGTVTGIANDTPNHRGNKVYYNLETARKLANGQPSVNTVILNTENGKALAAELEGLGWEADWVAGRLSDPVSNLWVVGLRSAGVLGLLVGGAGAACVMQALLRRRRYDIAIWKTLGYSEGSLRLIFSFEAGILGLAGSLAGALLGMIASTGLLELFWCTSSLLYGLTFSPIPPLMGLAAGVLTTLICAQWAILTAGQTRPAALLCGEEVEVHFLSGCQSVFMGLLLFALFTALTSVVMKSLGAGIGVLLFILFGLATLGVIFYALLWISTRLLLMFGFPWTRLALKNLQRRGRPLVFAMIAMFIGVISMSLGLAVTQRGQLEVSNGGVNYQGYNLLILAPAGEEEHIHQALAVQHVVKSEVQYRAVLQSLRLPGGDGVGEMEPVLVGLSAPDTYRTSGAEWGSRPDGVFAYRQAGIEPGSQVEVAFPDGATHSLTVVGSYDLNPGMADLYPPLGLVTTAETFARLTTPETLAFFVQAEPGRLNRTARALAAELPQATVINLASYAGRFMQGYQKLFILPLLTAGLAILAGLLLVANSVSLAMLDRRYEIGILRVVGYTPGQILSVFALEYGLASVLGAGAGICVVEASLALMALVTGAGASLILLPLPFLALIGLGSTGLTLLIVSAIAWKPANAWPLPTQ